MNAFEIHNVTWKQNITTYFNSIINTKFKRVVHYSLSQKYLYTNYLLCYTVFLFFKLSTCQFVEFVIFVKFVS